MNECVASTVPAEVCPSPHSIDVVPEIVQPEATSRPENAEPSVAAIANDTVALEVAVAVEPPTSLIATLVLNTPPAAYVCEPDTAKPPPLLTAIVPAELEPSPQV